MRAFSATRQVRAERQLLEHAANAVRAGAAARRSRRPAPTPLTRSPRHRAPACRPAAFIERRLAGTVMADQPQALADADREVDVGKRAHRAEAFVDAGEADDLFGGAGARWLCRSFYRLLRADHLLRVFQRVFDVGDAALLGGLARLASRLSWSMRRNGTIRSFGTSLPSRICCATQNASVGDAGRDRDRHGLVAVGVLLLLPPGELVLAVAHDDAAGVGRPAALKACARAIAVAALGHHGGDLGQRRQDAGDRLLRHVCGPVAMHRADDLELRVSRRRPRRCPCGSRRRRTRRRGRGSPARLPPFGILSLR